MEQPGQKLKNVRESLDLRMREVEQLSQRIVETRGQEYAISIGHLSDIENHSILPSIYKIYSLCAIYKLNFEEVLEWFGISLASLPADSMLIELPRTHPVNFAVPSNGAIPFPVAVDPGTDFSRTIFFSRMIQRWGTLPLLFLTSLAVKQKHYAWIGAEDHFMDPLLRPGSFVLIDTSRKTIEASGWTSDKDRPIYFLQHKDGYRCAWCALNGSEIVLVPHPASKCVPETYQYPGDIQVIGQITGVVMPLDYHR